ncbi:linear gramicidin synthetase subunit D domain protein, partial [Mycobacterium xenopi 4042]
MLSQPVSARCRCQQGSPLRLPHPGRGGDQVRRPLDELSRARRRSKPVAHNLIIMAWHRCMCSAAVASFRRRGGGDAGGAQNGA